jgi:glutamate synthase (NADPH/NADH) small chain
VPAIPRWTRCAYRCASAPRRSTASIAAARPRLRRGPRRYTTKLRLDKRGYIDTDENLATSIAGVYAGGDIVTGAATVIEAMGAGRRAARAMKAWLGLFDTDVVYAPEAPQAGRHFGFAPSQRGHARVRVA